jgi:hypothetical protein
MDGLAPVWQKTGPVVRCGGPTVAPPAVRLGGPAGAPPAVRLGGAANASPAVRRGGAANAPQVQSGGGGGCGCAACSRGGRGAANAPPAVQQGETVDTLAGVWLGSLQRLGTDAARPAAVSKSMAAAAAPAALQARTQEASMLFAIKLGPAPALDLMASRRRPSMAPGMEDGNLVGL